MARFKDLRNPFTVQSPETVGPEEIVKLFVDVFSDYPKILSPGHVFVHGPRGSGKSMMFRFMLPHCQMIANKCSLASLPYFAVYVPVKNTEFQVAEFARLDEKHASAVINEHIMVLYVAERLFNFLGRELRRGSLEGSSGETKAFMIKTFLRLLREAGWKGE